MSCTGLGSLEASHHGPLQELNLKLLVRLMLQDKMSTERQVGESSTCLVPWRWQPAKNCLSSCYSPERGRNARPGVLTAGDPRAIRGHQLCVKALGRSQQRQRGGSLKIAPPVSLQDGALQASSCLPDLHPAHPRPPSRTSTK